jgi:hypothetical protein
MKIICESKINNVHYPIDVNAKLLIIIILLPRSHIFQFVGNLVVLPLPIFITYYREYYEFV